MQLHEAEMIRTIQALMNLATEIPWRLTDVMVAKGVITKGEARSMLYALADGIRRDAHGTSCEEATEVLARTLENTAEEVWPRN